MNSPDRSPFFLENQADYQQWRARKLAEYPPVIAAVAIQNPYQLTAQEKNKMSQLLQQTNMALYALDVQCPVDKPLLRSLMAQFGLMRIDRTLTASEDGITALRVENEGVQQEYIPYTDQPINWHTDGYYNTLEQQVYGLSMHCVRPAQAGGENTLLDHEVAYIHLRDENPEYIEALQQPDAMTIPANVQHGQELRAASVGPVFSVNAQGRLHMRYTERKRNIVWKQDDKLTAARHCLTELLHSDSPYLLRHRLAPNEGIICNNVLHNRTGFSEGDTLAQQRLLYRIRFYDSVSG
ncbi:MAG: TauD/TfdA family dioxygenase [Thiotrichaceae bacterium]